MERINHDLVPAAEQEKKKPIRTLALRDTTKEGDAAIIVYELWGNGRITFYVSHGKGLLAFFRADFLQPRPNLVREDENAFRQLIYERAGSGKTKEIPVPQWYTDDSREKEFNEAQELNRLLDYAIMNPEKLSEGRNREKAKQMRDKAREELKKRGLLKESDDVTTIVTKLKKSICAS